MTKQLVYLASPYSHHDAAVRRRRFEEVSRCAALLMAQGVFIFSPIAHTHPIAEAGDLPRGFDFWERYDRAMLASCRSLLVCCLDGWSRSKGVIAECEIARELGIPIGYLFWPLDEDHIARVARTGGLVGSQKASEA